jgi:hypothetical protein
MSAQSAATCRSPDCSLVGECMHTLLLLRALRCAVEIRPHQVYAVWIDPRGLPINDDVASLGSDQLLRRTGFARGRANPFLPG